MKSLVVLIVLLVVLAGVAVNGSRAQPLPQTSVAFSHCQRHGDIALESRCRRPGGDIVPDAEEAGFDREYTVGANGFGGDYTDGEKWREFFIIVTELVQLVLNNWDRLIGSAPAVASAPHIVDTLFDPVK